MVIYDLSTPAWRPWPDGMPSGQVYVGDGLARFNALTAAWPKMVQSAFQASMYAKYTNPDGSISRGRLTAAPASFIAGIIPNNWSTAYAGVYVVSTLGHASQGSFTSTNVPGTMVHEFGHQVDFEWLQHHGQSTQSNISSTTAFQNYYNSIQSSLTSNVYAKKNVWEWFAENFAAYNIGDRLYLAISNEVPDIYGEIDLFGANTAVAQGLFDTYFGTTMTPLLPYDDGQILTGYYESEWYTPYPNGNGQYYNNTQFQLSVAIANPGTSPTYLWEYVAVTGQGYNPHDTTVTWTAVGGNSPTLLVTFSDSTNKVYSYRCTVTNANGTKIVRGFTAVCLGNNTPTNANPQFFIRPPRIRRCTEGDSITFYTEVIGWPVPTIQWQKQTGGTGAWNNISGATSKSLTITAAYNSGVFDRYRPLVTNSSGSATPTDGTGCQLVVTALPGSAPAVLTPSGAVSKSPGNACTSTASGSPTPTTQWQYALFPFSTWNNVTVGLGSGGTTATFTPADQFDSGNYRFRCVWTNTHGDTTADVADYYAVTMSDGGG